MAPLTLLDLSEAKRNALALRPKSVAAASPVRDVRESALFYGQPGGDGFRRISKMASDRDLTPPKHDRMQRVAYYLYVTNPLAKRIVEYLVDYICGDGILIEAEDPAVNDVLEDFWYDPQNNMTQTARELVRETAIFGEEVILCGVNPIDGRVGIGLVDPEWISAVEYATLEALPGKAVAGAAAVLLKPGAQEREGRRLEIIRADRDPMSPSFGRLRGECFYWAINKARSASRGISDLFAPADWISGYDQMLDAMMIHAKSLSQYIWDVKLIGMTEEQIAEWAAKNGQAPTAGSLRVHNEGAEWQAVSPQLGAYEMVAGAKAIRQMAITPWPEMMFSEGGDVNRATAVEQGGPAMKMLASRQLFTKERLAELADFVIDSAIVAGTLPETVNRKFIVKTPELSVRDLGQAATALQAAAQAIAIAQAAGMMDTETGVNVLAQLVDHLGVDVDPKVILEKARAEKDLQEQQDWLRQPPPIGDTGDPSRDRHGADNA